MSNTDEELIFHTLKSAETVNPETEITERYFANQLDRESVCGTDDRKRVTATQGLPYVAICKLFLTDQSGSVYVGTAWLTHSNKLYTAGHNLYDDKKSEWMKSVTVIPAKSGLSEPFGRYEASELMVTRGWMDKSSHRYDMGAIKLSSDVSHSEFIVPYQTDANRASVVGYPADRDRGNFQYEMESLVRKSNGQFHYFIDTYGGQSGSPCMIDGVRSIAIHNYGGCENSASDLYPSFVDGIENW